MGSCEGSPAQRNGKGKLQMTFISLKGSSSPGGSEDVSAAGCGSGAMAGVCLRPVTESLQWSRCSFLSVLG